MQEIFVIATVRECGCILQAVTPRVLQMTIEENEFFREQLQAGKCKVATSREEWLKVTMSCEKCKPQEQP